MSKELNPPPQPPETQDEEQSTPVELPDVATQPHPAGHAGDRPTIGPGTASVQGQDRPEEDGRPPEPGSAPADDVPAP